MTDEEIMQYDNVPATVAAKYLGVAPQTLMLGMRYGANPVGWAIDGKRWTYVIPPERLVKWKHGDTPSLTLDGYVKLITIELKKIIRELIEVELKTLQNEVFLGMPYKKKE